MHDESSDLNSASRDGLHARPDTLALDSAACNTVITTVQVSGMDCAEEVDAISRVFKAQSGISDFKVNLLAGTLTITHEREISRDRLLALIEKAGLAASIVAGEKQRPQARNSQNSRMTAVAISGVFTGAGLLLQWTELLALEWRILLFAAGIVAGAWFVLPKALRAVKQGALDMNVLMCVAVIGASAIGEWAEGAAVVFLFGLSELLETLSLNRARRAIRSLMQLAPDTALLKQGATVAEVPAKDVRVGDIVLVRSGAKIPLDGEVRTGESSVNQASITGESMPVDKSPGSQVFAGTLNGAGSLEVKVTKIHADSTLSRIIQLVEGAQSQKAPSQRFGDQFARVYTPIVFALALLTLLIPPLVFSGSWEDWIYRALVLLVIACPCALVISTPISVVSGLTALARRGVLVKGGMFLEEIGKLKALAVDKTGTITEGKPTVQRVIPWGTQTKEDILRIAAAIDIHSDHPLAQAVVRYASKNYIPIPEAKNYQARTGRGAEATIDSHLYFVGNHRFTHESAVCSPELEQVLSEIESNAMSVIVVGHKPHASCKGEVLGVLAVGDAVRANASKAIRSLHAVGVEKIVMLSGDNQRTVDAISKQVGIDEALGDLLPDQKIDRVRALLQRYGHVGMIGDGVNDAPAMAIASIGIAMGGAGTDTAIETADIALMNDDLARVAEAVALGAKTRAIIQANIAFSVSVKAIFLVLAVLGHISLWLAILADTGATLLVIANALRLLAGARKAGS